MLRLSGMHAEVLPLTAVRAGPEALSAELARRAAGELDALVCDAEAEDDLRAIAEAGAHLARPIVWTGSAGLAHYLPAALALRPDATHVAPPRARSGGVVLVVVGSRSSVAREQARALASERGVARVVLAPDALLASGRDGRSAADLEAALATGNDVLLLVGEEPVPLERGPELASAVGRLVAPHAARLAGVVATGGDLARAVLGALGATGLHLEGEVEPGVPLGVADSTPPLPVITKAGAFGTSATLTRCRAALRARAGNDGAGRSG
jgi:D-threonate/D-erythronate kinase